MFLAGCTRTGGCRVVVRVERIQCSEERLVGAEENHLGGGVRLRGSARRGSHLRKEIQANCTNSSTPEVKRLIFLRAYPVSILSVPIQTVR
jgi:hypothetical protein